MKERIKDRAYWLKQLPKSLRKRFKVRSDRFIAQRGDRAPRLTKEYRDLPHMIDNCLIWHESKEGHLFWSRVSRHFAAPDRMPMPSLRNLPPIQPP